MSNEPDSWEHREQELEADIAQLQIDDSLDPDDEALNGYA